MSDKKETQHGVQSLEIGMSILRAIVNGHRSMMLKDIAAGADMPASKAHRYLVSLIRAGLVEQDPATSHYDLGPFAMNIGLVAIDRLDRIRLGLAAIAELRDEINERTGLAVWGDRGPVIVRWERPRRPITVNVVTGQTLSMLTSASGRCFATWLPKNQTEALIARELATKPLPPDLGSADEMDALLAKVRADGVASVSSSDMMKGVEGMAAPVFNFRNEITMALVIVRVSGTYTEEEHQQAVAALRRSAAGLSRRLGA